MSGCDYCEDGEGAQLIKYAQAVKLLIENHKQRCGAGIGPNNEAYSALHVVDAIISLSESLHND